MEISRNKTVQDGLGKIVKLNVGGSLFQTTIATLTKTDSMLRAMFSGRLDNTKDADGCIFIDRDGKHFGTILNFLRDPSIPLPDNTRELQELLAEAKYYLIQELIDAGKSRKVEVNHEIIPPGYLYAKNNVFITGSPNTYVKIKVEDRPFHATIRTLTKFKSKLRPMFNGEEGVSINSEGYILIEGKAKYFHLILNYLEYGGPIKVATQDYKAVLDVFVLFGLDIYNLIFEKY